MESVKEPKLGPSRYIQLHMWFLGCSTSCALYITLNPSRLYFFLPLYILTLFSIKKCFFSVDIVFCNNRPLKERQWLHTLASFFSARIYLFHLIIRFHIYFQLLVKCHPSLSTIWVRLNGILSLIFALCGSTKDQIACEFHVCDVPLMRESTLR